MARANPSVVCVVLNWNNYPDTAECIESLRRLDYSNFEIIVVDNGSNDGSGKRLQSEFDDISVLFTATNLGFGGGNNVGIREAIERDSDYIWILNDDVVVTSSSLLTDLVETMETNHEIGVITPEVTEYPETDTTWFRKGYIDWRSGNAGHERTRRWFVDFRTSEANQALQDDLLYGEYMPFCSALVRTEIYEEIGLYPEEYFLYYGDVDFCAQISKEGYEIVTDTGTHIHHKVSASSETRRSPTHLYYLTRNRLIFRDRWSDRFTASFYVFYLWWALLNIGQLAYSRNWAGISALLYGLTDGIRKRTGPGKYP